MTIRRITLSDLAFGEPLRWDLFGPADGAAPKPLLQKGQLIAPGPQLDHMLAAGLYAEASAPSSVLHALNDINQRLERLLMDLHLHCSADKDLLQLANELIAAVELDPDVALATIFLNQIAGLYAVRHCVETAIVALVVGRALNGPRTELATLAAAAMTMNVAMVRQTEGFQCKDCALSSEERALVQRHPSESAKLLSHAGVTEQEWLDYVLLHHENEDGSGYPQGKLGDEIPRNAKLIGMADRYCAFVSARNYRRSMLPDQALRKLCIDTDVTVDHTVAALFAEQIGAFPPGSLVRMKNGEAGVVVRRQDGALSVHALRGADGQVLRSPQPRNANDPEYAIKDALQEDQLGVRFSMKQVWGELAAL